MLLEVPEQPERGGAESGDTRARAKKYRYIDRDQMLMRAFSLEAMIGEDHKARGIWDLTGTLDLSAFEENVRSLVDE